MNGNNIIIYRDGTAIAAMKSNKIQTEAGTIEIASASQQEWEEFVVGRKRWSLTTDFLVTTSDAVLNLLRNGERCVLSVRDRENNVILQGNAICTTCDATFTWGALARGTFIFKGNGALAQPAS